MKCYSCNPFVTHFFSKWVTPKCDIFTRKMRGFLSNVTYVTHLFILYYINNKRKGARNERVHTRVQARSPRIGKRCFLGNRVTFDQFSYTFCKKVLPTFANVTHGFGFWS